MLHALINFLLNRKGEPPKAAEPQAPYKIETPELTKCGCGRSSTGYCVGLHKLSESEWAVHADNPNKKPAVEVQSGGDWPFPKPAEKPAAEPKARKPRAKKPAATKTPAAITPAKKPRAKKAAVPKTK